MADRIFSGLLLLVSIGYGVMAFTVIKAPFQYDPLGPESWPRILSVVSALCCLGLLARPDTERLDLTGKTSTRLVVLLVLLAAYAALFEPLGFVIATLLFCAVLARILGATMGHAMIFGVATGILGFGVGAMILELNLPAGPLRALM
ncbi:MAG: tripartite tricarboxylate transporter TctB family protein [Rhodospirillum sp.]|nr:tripartite tricarboxylate transporter TctB family protein [Rhodospirillum sp.]MCF8491998.1 tripartite tricarboxylate transporter TctB family protein [Rhodospirillum sp.]MCF8502480.1 tripartite tricarboxylate transporter TctB family protein [Rhodospirillum sp.]